MNNVIVITGGSSGIGEHLVKLFCSNGDRVYMLSRTNPHNYDRYIKCDVSDEEQVKSAFLEIKKAEKSIDILINNAGLGISGATEFLPSEQVQHVMNVNFMGTFYCCKYSIPLMKAGGKIVNISSVIAIFSRPFHSVYCAAKAAVSMFSYGLRMELSTAKIQVTSICPTGIETNFSKNRIMENETNERYNARIQKAAESVNKRSRMPAEVCARRMYEKINKKRLKAMYIIGNNFKVLHFFQKFFPLSVILKITNKKFGGIN